MRRIRLIPLLLAMLLLFACGGDAAQKNAQSPENTQTSDDAQTVECPVGPDDVVLTAGSEPVYASVYRFYLNDRYSTIKEHGLDDHDTYLSYVSNPNINYLYAYYDTRTEEGMKALCEDVLMELARAAAALDTGAKAGYELNAAEQSYLLQAETDAEEKLDDRLSANGGAYQSREAFLKANGFTEERYKEMFVRDMKAGILYNRILEDYKATNTLTDEELEAGYARIVKETFTDRYTDGMYSRYLFYYLQGKRTFPSLYIPEDAIFIRLFAKTDPTDAEIEAFRQRAEEDFAALYESRDNEFTTGGIATDLAIAPNDELFEGLYNAAKDIAIGSIGSVTLEKDGKTAFYLFLRVEGETGVVPIDRYPGVRERITNQLLGTKCMDTLREKLADPAYAVRNEEMIEKVVSSIG